MKLTKTQEMELNAELNRMKASIMNGTQSLVDNLKSEIHDDYSDPFDRAKSESDHTIHLRIEDRKQKLISKINEALKRLERGEVNNCSECGQFIGFKRLMARPVTDMCINCKEEEEKNEEKVKQRR